MKLKLLWISILLILLTLGAVSAEDNLTDNLDLSADDSDDVIAQSDGEAISSTPKSFGDVQNIIDSASEGDTVEISGTYEGNGTPIKINKGLTIIGKDNAVLDAKEMSKIIKRDVSKVSSDKLILKDITFVNGYNSYGANSDSYFNHYDDYGGAMDGGCLFNCTFINCYAIWAGALSNSTAVGCTFINCSAQESGAAMRLGSAENSTFVNCYCEGLHHNSDASTVFGATVKNSRFIDCSSKYGGTGIAKGAAYNCTFINSYSEEGNGGVLYKSPAYNCTFINSISDGVTGGVIYGASAYGSTFINCSVEGKGGAICLGSAYDSSFINCTAFKDGGAIFRGSAYNCTFKECFASNYAGAVYGFSYEDDEDDVFEIVGCTFENIQSTAGAVCNMNVKDSTFMNCNAERDGGAIYDGNASKSKFIKCSSQRYGGAIYYGSAYDCIFTDNSAHYGGSISDGIRGSIYVGESEHPCEAVRCEFTNCHANDGGALYNVSAAHSTFKNCSAGKDGGAIYDGDASDSTFMNCAADRYGGAIYYGDANKCTFTSNSAKSGGAMSGGIWGGVDDSPARDVTAVKCEFKDNHANVSGGALFDVSQSGSTFTQNTAPNGNDMWYSIYDNVKIQASNRNVIYTYDYDYTIKVYGFDEKIAKNTEVVVKINNKTFKTLKTDNKGVAEFKITQTPGNYVVSISALFNTVTKNLTVKHFMTFKSVKVKKSAKKLVLTAKLKRKYNNEKITFKFNGKKYTALTKKGVAKVTIKKSVLKKLKVGKKVKYQAAYRGDVIKYSAKVMK